MRIEPFKPEHMAALLPRLNVDQTLDHDLWTPGFCERMRETCEVFAGMTDDGRVMTVAGAMRLWEERYHLFAYMAEDSGPYMTSITRGVLRFLSTLRGRVETQVSEHFEAGHKWVRMMGFELETPNGMANFFPGERKGFMYAKVLH